MLDTRVVNCGDNKKKFASLPDACVETHASIYIDPPLNSNRTVEYQGEVFSGEMKEKRHLKTATPASIDYMWLRCVQFAYVLKKTGIIISLN